MFEGCLRKVCRLGWWTLDSLEQTYDDEAVSTGLHYSWNQFSLTEDAALFEELVQDPAVSFYANGAGGAELYTGGEEAPYFPSFADVSGTWYLQYAWTDEAVWYVGKELSEGELTILDNGLLYANYSNAADPRGPYLITEMKMVSDAKADGTDGDDWVVVYESDDGLWQMQLRPDPENQRMDVVWYEWTEEDRSDEPTGVNLVYSRTAG